MARGAEFRTRNFASNAPAGYRRRDSLTAPSERAAKWGREDYPEPSEAG